MGRTIKTRHVQKDIKVLDKTVTAAEHMKGAYIRTRDSAEQTQGREQGTPVGYAEDQVMEKGERAARGTVQQSGKQGKKVIHAVRERGRAKNEAEAFRKIFRLFFFVRYRKDLPAERADEKPDRSADRADSRRAGGKERSTDPGTSKADGQDD